VDSETTPANAQAVVVPSIIRFGGAVCLTAWFLLIYSGEIWGLDYVESAASVVSLTALSLGACFITLTIVNLARAKVVAEPRSSKLYFIVIGLVLSVATTGVALRFLLPQPLYILSCLAIGCTGALFLGACLKQLSLYSPKHILITCGAIFLAGIFIYAFSFYIPQVLRTPLLCLLPLLACLFFVFDRLDDVVQGQGGGQEDASSEGRRSPVAWRTLVVLAVFVFSSCIIRGYLPLSMDNEFFSYIRSFSVIFMFVAVTAITVIATLLPSTFDYSRILWVVLLMGLVFFALVPIFGLANPFVLALTDAYRGLNSLLAITFMACLARQVPFWGLRNIGGGLAFYVVFGLLGWIIGSLLFTQAFDAETLSIVSSLQCVLVLIVFLFLYRQAEASRFMTVAVDISPGTHDTSTTETESEATEAGGRWRRRCEHLAETYGLSSREKEVFFLLAKGYKKQNISDKLSISYNTTRAHIRNIYVKCDVHSQSEFMELFEKTSIE
jgi:DNA-binding CsgD family transcriptional regulator